jgi:hypothetical protein
MQTVWLNGGGTSEISIGFGIQPIRDFGAMVSGTGQHPIRRGPAFAQQRHDPMAEIVAIKVGISVAGVVNPVKLLIVGVSPQIGPICVQQRAQQPALAEGRDRGHGRQSMRPGAAQ